MFLLGRIRSEASLLDQWGVRGAQPEMFVSSSKPEGNVTGYVRSDAVDQLRVRSDGFLSYDCDVAAFGLPAPSFGNLDLTESIWSFQFLTCWLPWASRLS